MDLTPYVEGLRRDLVDAANAGDEHVRDAAERLTLALAPAARLALMEALSQAADEITSEMRSGSVDVRLAGRQLDFVVSEDQSAPVAPAPPAPPTPPTPPEPPEPEQDLDEPLARVTLRIPESLKAQAEQRATKAGQSLNAWLLDTVRAATNEHAVRVDVDLSSVPFVGDAWPGRGRTSRRMTGWV